MSELFISLSFFLGAILLVAVSDILVNRFHRWLDGVRVSIQDQGNECFVEEYVEAVCDGDVVELEK